MIQNDLATAETEKAKYNEQMSSLAEENSNNMMVEYIYLCFACRVFGLELVS